MPITITPLSPTVVLSQTVDRIDDEGGAPLRCCLRDSRAGELVRTGVLTPPGPKGVYAETGPVFVHAEPCGGPTDAGYPEQFRTRRQVFRTYGSCGQIVGGEIVEPDDDQEAVAARLLSDPQVSFLHSRNAIFGCYMFAIERG